MLKGDQKMALLALSHTPVEHQLYRAMLAETSALSTKVGCFTVRRLMQLTGLNSYSTVRRGLTGLHDKRSVERQRVAGISGGARP